MHVSYKLLALIMMFSIYLSAAHPMLGRKVAAKLFQ